MLSLRALHLACSEAASCLAPTYRNVPIDPILKQNLLQFSQAFSLFPFPFQLSAADPYPTGRTWPHFYPCSFACDVVGGGVVRRCCLSPELPSSKGMWGSSSGPLPVTWGCSSTEEQKEIADIPAPCSHFSARPCTTTLTCFPWNY